MALTKIVKKLTENHREFLLSQTPRSTPDNPTESGWSASKIRQYQWQGFSTLFTLLDSVESRVIEYLNNTVTTAIDGNSGDIAILTTDISNEVIRATNAEQNLAISITNTLTSANEYTDTKFGTLNEKISDILSGELTAKKAETDSYGRKIQADRYYANLSISVNATTGVMQFKFYNAFGEVVNTIIADTNLERIASIFDYDETTKMLYVIDYKGDRHEIDLSSLIDTYIADNQGHDCIVTIENNKVSADLPTETKTDIAKGVTAYNKAINLEDSVATLQTDMSNAQGDIGDLETTKADKDNVYTKGETEARLAEKQPVGDYATNTDLDNLETRVGEVEENKADKSEVNEVASDLRTTKTRVSAVERAVGLLEEESLNLSEVLDIVDAGLAKNYFKAGDQFHVNWKEDDTTSHNIDHDVVDLEDVIVLENGEEVTKHALTLQWHFSIVDVPFDNAEFMAKTKTTMPAGTYHFKVQHDSWGGNNGKSYQFTATSDIPAGSFLRPTNNYDQSMAGKNMNVYADWGDSTATASYAISEGSDGVDLGTMSSKTEQGQASTYFEACEEKGNIYLNDYQAVVLGDNNYYYSYVRQYLNATTTGFFTQQHIFDRPPSDWSTKRGFLAGYDDEFISAIKPTKRVISSNTLVYGGANYTMYDKIFLPTMANMNVDGWSAVQNTGGVEGNAYEYYKDLAVGQSNLNPNGTFKANGTYAILKKYNYKNKGSAVYYWSSSALRSRASDSLGVYASGYVDRYGGASYRGAVSPAFNLIK